MFVIRSFDVNKPGISYENLQGGVLGGSLLQGKLKVGDEVEILPGYLERKGDKIVHEPLYAEVTSLSTRFLRLKEARPGGLIGVQTDLDPSLMRADRMIGNVIGAPGTLPDVVYEVEMTVHLFEYVVGTEETVRVTPIQRGEPLRINIGSATTLAAVTGVKGDSIEVKVMKPMVVDEGWKAAIARRVDGRWRLIGVGVVE